MDNLVDEVVGVEGVGVGNAPTIGCLVKERRIRSPIDTSTVLLQEDQALLLRLGNVNELKDAP